MRTKIKIINNLPSAVGGILTRMVMKQNIVQWSALFSELCYETKASCYRQVWECWWCTWRTQPWTLPV